MKESFKATLQVNKTSIELNSFVEQFLAQVVFGAVSSLKGVEDVQSLELYLEQGDTNIIIDGDELPLIPFPKEIITNTIVGLVSSLKGVEKINSLKETWVAHFAKDYAKREKKAEEKVLFLAKQLGIKYVATNPSHYLKREDCKAHEILLNIRSGEKCEIWVPTARG